MAESSIARGERGLRDSEYRVRRLEALIEALDRDGYFLAAPQAREVLATLRRSLDLAHARLRAERALRDLDAAARGTAPAARRAGM
jgi:hypothetical protein